MFYEIMLQIQQIKLQQLQVLNLSPSWINFIKFIQQHPFVTFEKLKFVNGNPDWGEIDLKIKESIKF